MEKKMLCSADGLLAHLELLEAEACQAAVKLEEEEKVQRLKAKVEELRLRRDQLKAKISQQQNGGPGEEGASGEPPAPPDALALLQWKVKNLQNILQIFYLTGISGKLSRRGVCFSLSTAFQGTYLDSFHLEVLTEPRVRIHRHSIPIFIPLEQLSQQYLQTDIRRFLALLSDHLNAYVGRRHQADQLQEHFADQIQGTLQRNSLCNLLVFNYDVSRKSRSFPFMARLLYRDPCSCLPTEATVSCQPKSPASLVEAAAAHSDLFLHMPLHEAFRSFSSIPQQDGSSLSPPLALPDPPQSPDL